jgi:signal transduction histidine kinase
MKLLPRSLFGQMLLALVAGMAVSLTLTVWFLMHDRARQFDHFMGVHVAQRVVNLVAILDGSTPDERNRLIRIFNTTPYRHMVLDQPWAILNSGMSQQMQTFTSTLSQELGPDYPVQILFLGKAGNATGMAPADPRDLGGRFTALRAVIQVRLGDGTVLTLSQSFPAPHASETYLIIGSLILMGLTIALLTGWVVRRLTLPLRALANAANSLVLNLDQPPVPVTGSAEVASAASAFNAMQKELKKLLETRSQALAGVSHDLRLPITRLRLRAERISDPELKAEIAVDLDEMDAMIATTLDFLRAGRSSEKQVKLNLAGLLELVSAEMEEAGATVKMSGAIPARILTRPIALRRCLTNLMDNARRYGGGQIDVDVSSTASTVEIRIGDHGPGIPTAETDRVFEPYVRLDTSRSRDTGGTGLGLSIARAIARQEGGDIRLESRPGGGLLAILSLPAYS